MASAGDGVERLSAAKLCVLVMTWSCVTLAESSSSSEQLQLTYHVDEEISVGTFIGNVITDARLVDVYPAGVVSELRFRFLRHRVAAFSVDPVAGVLTTSARLDREHLCGTSTDASTSSSSGCLLRMDVAVQPMQFFRIVRVLVNVRDINDNAPGFADDVIHLSVSESVSAGTLLPLPTATDPDQGRFSVTGYRLQADDDTFDLQVSTDGTGGTLAVQLKVARQLDRELLDRYSLRVFAMDGDEVQGASNSGYVDVLITVTDVNDNSPVFEGEGRYEVTIPENLPLQTTILTVQAVDDDEGLNGQVRYSLGGLTSMQHGRIFAINSTSGDLYVRGPIDYEQSSIYQLTVIAADLGGPPDSGSGGARSATASVTVYVTDENDHRPRIDVEALSSAPGRATTPEAAPVGSFVAHVIVVDVDAGANGRVSCILDGNDSGLFRLQPVPAVQDSDGDEYQLLTAAVLDRETTREYHLKVTCHDSAPGGNSKTRTETLTVDVADVNDNDPVFSQTVYYSELIENNYVGALVLQNVSAVDADAGENSQVEYSLEFPWNDVDGFHIDAQTGAVTAARSFDREQSPHALRFLVVASDRGRPVARSSSATAVVTIIDVNDESPVFVDVPPDSSGGGGEDRYVMEVRENMPAGTLVGRITARDADHGRNAVVTYTLSSPDDEAGVESFQMDSVSGEIRTRRVLDHELQTAFWLVVTASDGASPPMSNPVQVFVRVLDENDNAPQFVSDGERQIEGHLTVAVSPRLPPGAVVAALHAVDADDGPNAHVTYRLLPVADCRDSATPGYDVMLSNDVIGVPPVPARRRQCGLFSVDRERGELTLEGAGSGLSKFVDGTELNLTVSATDSGVPIRTGTVLVRVVVNSTVPVPSTVPTQHHRYSDGMGWIALLLNDGIIIVCSLAVFVVVACCLSVVVVILATRRSRARQRRSKYGYNVRAAEEEKALGVAAAAAGDRSGVGATSLIVYGSCESPRTVPSCHWEGCTRSPGASRNGRTPQQLTT